MDAVHKGVRGTFDCSIAYGVFFLRHKSFSFMRFVRFILMCMILSVLGACAWLAWFAFQPIQLATAPLDISIRTGGSLRSITQQMIDEGLHVRGWDFVILARVLGKESAIKAGSYEIASGTTPLELLRMLTRGDVRLVSIALIEGWTFRQVREALDTHPDLAHETRGLSDAELMARIGAAESNPEGLFFPDTYLFSKQSSDLEVLKRAYRAMQHTLDTAWAVRSPDLPYRSPYEALIMASIIEKETGMREDRPLIASVFVNRLKAGMLLQTDPTVIYGLGTSFDGNLRKKDLQTDGPYNTYLRSGLPPTPIALPGVASIQAALAPPPSDYLYFVSRGDGTSAFSATLDEHNRAVIRFQKRR